MFPSLEVRWFYAGTAPQQLVEWFQQGEQELEAQQCRVDHYLRLGDTDALGIKLREGRIEIKQRHSQHGVVRFHERVVGQVEQWRKWSLGVSGAVKDLSGILVPASSWVGVRKKRSLLGYRPAGGKGLLPVPARESPPQGCSVELANLRAEGQDWWSLCFEAFGAESSLHQTLALAVTHMVTRREIPFAFEAAKSYGYPRWIALLGEGTGN